MTLYTLYKYVIYIPWLLLWTATNFLGVALVAPFSPRYASRWFGRLWGRGLMYMVPARVQVVGEQELDKSQPYVVVSNHLSLVDIPILYGWLPLDLKWVVKKELRRVPFIGAGCALMGHIFLDRDNREVAIQQLQQGERELPPGTSVMFFAEGTRSRDGKLRAFKKGPFQMAKDLKIAILPITLCNTNRILPPDAMDLRPDLTQMIIHPPITAETVFTLSCDDLRDQARNIIGMALVTRSTNPPLFTHKRAT